MNDGAQRPMKKRSVRSSEKKDFLLVLGTLRYIFQSGNYQARGIPLKSIKSMCIILVLGSWLDIWTTGIVNIITLSRCTTFTLLEYSGFALATTILF